MQNVKKVVYISTASNMSGATLALLEIIDQMRQLGVEPVVVTASRGEFENRLRQRGVRFYKALFFSWLVHDHELETFAGKVKWKIKQTLANISEKKIDKILQTEKPDILHINTGISPVGISSAKKRGIPIVWHIREDPVSAWNRHPFDSKYEKECLEKAGNILCISKYIASRYDDRGLHNVRVLYDGVDLKKFEHERMKLFSGNTVELALCGSNESKGHIEAIYAIKKIVSEGIGIKPHLTLWGNIEKVYREKLENIIETNQLSQYVSFGGYTNNLFEKLLSTDITLICTDGEGFGRVTVEAMAAGSVVIGADSGATPELLTDGNGVIYHKSAADDLAEKIELAVKNPENARAIAAHGKKSVDSGRFDMDRYISDLGTIYDDLTAASSRRAE